MCLNLNMLTNSRLFGTARVLKLHLLQVCAIRNSTAGCLVTISFKQAAEGQPKVGSTAVPLDLPPEVEEYFLKGTEAHKKFRVYFLHI